jgi:thiamine biosynthesis lipoprotein
MVAPPRISGFLAAVALYSSLSACAAVPLERHEFTARKMGCPFRLVLYTQNAEAAAAAAMKTWERIDEIEGRLSNFLLESEVSRLVQAARAEGGGPWTGVSSDLWRNLVAADELRRATSGAFDVTVAPLVKLWRRTRRAQRVPGQAELADACALVGGAALLFNFAEKQVRLERRGLAIDLGGIAKGFALDEALDLLAREGIERVLVDGGGDLRVGRAPPGRRAWRVEVEAPGENLRLELVNEAVATSGDAYRFVEIGGQRYSHIIDPRTGWALSGAATVCVVAPTAMAADGAASAASVLGPEEGLCWVGMNADLDVCFFWREKKDTRTCASPGFDGKMAKPSSHFSPNPAPRSPSLP